VRLLLDIRTFLWIVTGSSRLSKNAAQCFSDPANEVFLSVAADAPPDRLRTAGVDLGRPTLKHRSA
jgi:hypothetical protein